jgi:ubiquinone/menaquinone biosynthesis C-methylase UbiE
MTIEKAYNIWAGQYDTNKNSTRDLDHKSTVQTLKEYSFENVIELGCGTGKNTMYLLKRAKKVLALDFSQEMLNKAKMKINDSKVNFQKADITIKWKVSNSFADLITSSLILEHIEDLDFIFDQAFIKLKPKGLFFISELHPFKQYLGTKARYEDDSGIKELTTFTHHISEFINSAKRNNFKLLEFNEWFDSETENKVPRLVSFVFQK